MILCLDNVLSAARVAAFMVDLANASWEDGRATAGYQSALAKRNLQLPEKCKTARRLGAEIVAALNCNLLFQAAALPAEIFPPLFNRYAAGHEFGAHVDSAMRPLACGGRRLRTDLSATLFLSSPESYDGGELIIEDASDHQSIKLGAGAMVLYPATTLHHVAPVTRGERVASFFWIQSLVSDDAKRTILFDMDISLQRLRQEIDELHPALITLTGVYNNLIRQWAIP